MARLHTPPLRSLLLPRPARPPGSGKSLDARLRFLIDPTTAAFAPIPHNPRQLLSIARNQWVLAFDQISILSPALSEAFCRLASCAGAIVSEAAPADPTRDLVMQSYRRLCSSP